MLSCSRISLTIVNTVSLLAAIIHVFTAPMWENEPRTRPCVHDNISTILWLAIFIAIMAAIGILGSCFKLKAFQDIYLWVLLILTIATTVSTCFILVLMPKQPAFAIFSERSNGYWLKGYTPALQTALVNERDWYVVKTCFIEKQVCQYKTHIDDTGMNYVQVGCCRPPLRCGLVQKNVSYWEPPPTGLASKDEECNMWVRFMGTECYNCDACKAGYLAGYQEDWDENIAIVIIRMVLLISVSILACHAFKDDHRDVDDTKPGKRVNRV